MHKYFKREERGDREMLSKVSLAYISFFASVAFAVTGLLMPPPSQIHESVLIYCAQLLLFAAVLLGVNVDKASIIASVLKRLKSEEKEKEELS